ncbi:MAG: RNB domain-containing ribonuclease, partial [Haliea sp.]
EQGSHPEISKSLMKDLKRLHSLYKVLRGARGDRGAIDFETTETRILFNEQRKIDAIVPVVRNDAHKIVEECMLCANVAAARFYEEHKLPVLYRVHEGPTPEKLENLRAFLGELGLDLRGGDKPTPAHYGKLLDEVQSRDDANVIQTMLLRSLRQAVYQPENEGHFGLHYPAYAHFTSPIRRYADLLVHRGIRHIIRSKVRTKTVVRQRGAPLLPKEDIFPYDERDMVAYGMHCSMSERRADDATRDVESWLKCEFLQDHVGDEFDGIIAAVTSFGLFVELQPIYIEGLVHISALPGDYYSFDASHQRLVGERSGRSYKLGGRVRVQVARVDLDDKKVDLEMIDSKPPEGGASRKSRKPAGKKAASGRSGQGKKSDAPAKKSGAPKKKAAAASKPAADPEQPAPAAKSRRRRRR